MSNPNYILRAFVETPWAILPGKLAALAEIVARHVSGEKLDADEVQTRIHGAVRPPERRVNSVAVLPLFGTIFPRANMMTEVSGATSAERFGAMFLQLVDDPTVDAIVLDVDSPGGQAGGINELSKTIFDARGRKPIVAVANHFMASAAYWIGSAADELVVTPSGEVGSIGAFAVHEDISAALAQDGIKISIIKDGKYKAEANPYEALSEEARAAIQARVSDVYSAFVEAVARNRGIESAAVRNGFGEGRMVGAYQAVSLGMADRVETLTETIDRLLNKNVPSALAGNRNNASITDQQNNTDGQAPTGEENQSRFTQERARLAAESEKEFQGANIMNLRELLKQRESLLARATELVELADKENRDFTDEERKEYQEILGVGETTGQIGALDAKIEQIIAEREKLRIAAEKKFSTPVAEKPEADHSSKIMKRTEFDKLSDKDRMSFIKSGGRVED